RRRSDYSPIRWRGGEAVAYGDAADRKETQRRIDAAIAGASASHMSNAKWRKLFAALRELGVGPLRWKFVRDDRVFLQSVPRAHAGLERTLGGGLAYPYGPFREIGWVAGLAVVGHLPIQQLDSGVRVVGYTW